MADAFKLAFSSFAAPRTGVLVVFCDDSLKFGAATRRVLGRGRRPGCPGRSGRSFQRQERERPSTLSRRPWPSRRPPGGRRLWQAGRDESEGFRQARRRRDGQGSRTPRTKVTILAELPGGDERRNRPPTSPSACGCAPIRSTATRPRRRTTRTRPAAVKVDIGVADPSRRAHGVGGRASGSPTASCSRATSSTSRRICSIRRNSPAARARLKQARRRGRGARRPRR